MNALVPSADFIPTTTVVDLVPLLFPVTFVGLRYTFDLICSWTVDSAVAHDTRSVYYYVDCGVTHLHLRCRTHRPATVDFVGYLPGYPLTITTFITLLHCDLIPV